MMNIPSMMLYRIKEAHREAGFFATLILVTLSVLALPAVFVHEGWQLLWPEKYRRTAAEILFMTWLAANIFALQMIQFWPAVVVVPAVRLFDILYTRVFLLVRATPPQSSARSLLLLLTLYFEVVVIYACWYIWLGIHTGRALFSMGGEAVQLSPASAFYFSLVTATTVGYGDITPALGLDSMPFWLTPYTTICAELMTVLFIVAIEVPRVFFSFGTKLER